MCYWSIHSQLEIFKRFKLDPLLSSARRNLFRIRSRSLSSSFHLGLQGSDISIHNYTKQCKPLQYNEVWKAGILVFLKSMCQPPFNMPYAFSVTTRALHNPLLKYFFWLSLIFSLYALISQSNCGKALSPIVDRVISLKSPSCMARSGITFPSIISEYVDDFFNNLASGYF